MNLDKVQILELSDCKAYESGLDSADNIGADFFQYPHSVVYEYNERGFRDRPWPKNLNDVIWCVGDSFTSGLGVPVEHTWWYQLEQITHKRSINVSMDGASNQWIARQARYIQTQIGPVPMVVMWSYVHRRENPDTSLSDLERRVWFDYVEDHDDIIDWLVCFDSLSAWPIVHSVIPEAGSFFKLPSKINSIWQKIKLDNWPAAPMNRKDYLNLDRPILKELNQKFRLQLWDLQNCWELMDLYMHNLDKVQQLIIVDQKDFGRDQHHFDIITARVVAQTVSKQLKY